MKKKLIHILLATAAFLMFTACVKELYTSETLFRSETADSEKAEELTYLEAALGDTPTKTAMSAFDGSWKTLWQAKDKIAVFFDNSSGAVDFSLKKGEGQNIGVFSGNGNGKVRTALYPAMDAISKNGTRINLNLPETQTYAKGSFGPDSYPMVAAPTSGIMQFRNLCSTIKVQLKGHHVVDSIRFTANGSNISVCGPASVDVDFTDAPSLKMDSGGSGNVTLNVGNVLLDPDEITDFYIVLPAQTYRGGFTLNIFTPAGSMARSTNSDVTVERSKVHSLTPFYVKLDDGLEPSVALEGSGTEASPLLIKNLSDLITMASSVNAGAKVRNTEGKKINAGTSVFRLENDLNVETLCSEGKKSWTPIGENNLFWGLFDGGGHKITNLYIDTEKSNVGFIGNLGGTVKNLCVSGSVKSTQVDAGIVVGFADDRASIENCSAYGEISSSHTSGDSHIGGVVGNPNTANINGCVNYASVSGGTCVGGVAGISGGNLSNCINYGNIDAKDVGEGDWVSFTVGDSMSKLFDDPLGFWKMFFDLHRNIRFYSQIPGIFCKHRLYIFCQKFLRLL